MTHRERLFLFVLLICAQGSSVAGLPSQGENYAEIRATKHVETLRIEEPIVIDGRLDEAVWQRAQPADEFYQQSPDEGELATRQTEVRFLYDDTTLYVGAMMYDDQPEGLVINELRRDFGGSSSDTFGLVLSLFRDGQTVSVSSSTRGVRRATRRPTTTDKTTVAGTASGFPAQRSWKMAGARNTPSPSRHSDFRIGKCRSGG